MPSPTIAVSLEQDNAQALDLAKRLGLPLVEIENGSDFDMVLAYTSQGLVLRDNRHPRMQPICATSNKPAYAVNRSDLLAKAMGKGTTTILDATAGLGRDAVLLWRLGYTVTAVERSPVVAALLQDMVDRTQALLPQHKRIAVIREDSIKILSQPIVSPDVVYLDPMFPPKSRTSIVPKKELQLLRVLVGEHADADELFEVAMKSALKRVVVKRPIKSPPLVRPPSVSHTGKLIRYDVYSSRSQRA